MSLLKLSYFEVETTPLIKMNQGLRFFNHEIRLLRTPHFSITLPCNMVWNNWNLSLFLIMCQVFGVSEYLQFPPLLYFYQPSENLPTSYVIFPRYLRYNHILNASSFFVEARVRVHDGKDISTQESYFDVQCYVMACKWILPPGEANTGLAF